MIRAALVLSLAALAGPVAAETYSEAYGLGTAEPHPEAEGDLRDGIRLMAILQDRKHNRMPVVTSKQPVYVQLYVQTPAVSAPATLKLFCEYVFVDAIEEKTWLKDGAACADELVATGGGWAALGKPFKFYPEAKDPSGTSAVNIAVREVSTDSYLELSPTFDWQGGLMPCCN